MSIVIETLADFEATLKALPADAPLIFTTRDGAIKAGYHVTEFKVADINSVDCGGKVDHWQEASMQLLDGFGGEHMAVGKFLGILGHSIVAVKGLATAGAFVEFAPMNVGLRSYQLSAVTLHDGVVEVALKERGPMCKAANRVAAPKVEASAKCCGIPLPRCC